MILVTMITFGKSAAVGNLPRALLRAVRRLVKWRQQFNRRFFGIRCHQPMLATGLLLEASRQDGKMLIQR